MVTTRGIARDSTPTSIAIRGLMVAAAVAFALASLVHFGATIALGPLTIDDPYQGAALPEAIIAVALGIGSVSLIARWPVRRWLALGTAVFSLLLTAFGLTITLALGPSRTGDVVYHVTVLVVLVVIVGLLVASMVRRDDA